MCAFLLNGRCMCSPIAYTPPFLVLQKSKKLTQAQFNEFRKQEAKEICKIERTMDLSKAAVKACLLYYMTQVQHFLAFAAIKEIGVAKIHVSFDFLKTIFIFVYSHAKNY